MWEADQVLTTARISPPGGGSLRKVWDFEVAPTAMASRDERLLSIQGGRQKEAMKV